MMVIVKVKKLGNWALQIYAGEVITPRKVVFLAVLFITDGVVVSVVASSSRRQQFESWCRGLFIN